MDYLKCKDANLLSAISLIVSSIAIGDTKAQPHLKTYFQCQNNWDFLKILEILPSFEKFPLNLYLLYNPLCDQLFSILFHPLNSSLWLQFFISAELQSLPLFFKENPNWGAKNQNKPYVFSTSEKRERKKCNPLYILRCIYAFNKLTSVSVTKLRVGRIKQL